MEQENFTELFDKVSKMMENGKIPENIKNILNNSLSNSQQNPSNSSYNSNSESNSDTSPNSSDDENSFNFDFETIMKIQQIMNNLKNEKNDPRTNLLMSLKPYLKDSRKQKIEQYINIFKITKIMDLFNNVGGESSK